jgi:hypothetical protein
MTLHLEIHPMQMSLEKQKYVRHFQSGSMFPVTYINASISTYSIEFLMSIGPNYYARKLRMLTTDQIHSTIRTVAEGLHVSFIDRGFWVGIRDDVHSFTIHTQSWLIPNRTDDVMGFNIEITELELGQAHWIETVIHRLVDLHWDRIKQTQRIHVNLKPMGRKVMVEPWSKFHGAL